MSFEANPETSSRCLDNRLNVFKGIRQNPFFIAVNIVIITVQVLFVFFGGEALSVAPLSAKEWAISLLLGVMCMPVAVLIRLTPDEAVRGLFGLGQKRQPAEMPVLEAANGSPWHQAVENVRCGLASSRRARSSRLGHLAIMALIKAKIFGQVKDGSEEEADERTPLLWSTQSRSRTSSIYAPAAVMAGLVAGVVGGWPAAPSPTHETW
jgi:Ca2+-transporting ATPase